VRNIETGTLGLIVAFAFVVQASFAFGSSNYKCKKPACDVSAIGHRKLFEGPSVGNWYSTEKEKELGAKDAATVEKRVDILKDSTITDYVDQVAQRIAQNSDADIPITVRVIRRDEVGAFNLFGGHLYLTTGLLLKLHNEGELASVLARGIAHAAMRSVARLQTRSVLMEIANMPVGSPLIAIDSVPHAPANNDIAIQVLGAMKIQRELELDADYFGIQYVYKAGYDTNCFLSELQSLWPQGPTRSLAQAFYPFPPLAERVKRLNQEIDDILPNQTGAVISTSAFDEFMAHVRAIPSEAPEKDAKPKLVRHDPS